MKEDKITVIAARVGEPLHLEDIDNTLEAMQEFVGGYIEAVGLEDGAVIICNEEGKLLGLPFNRGFEGNFFICEAEGDEFVSVGWLRNIVDDMMDGGAGTQISEAEDWV